MKKDQVRLPPVATCAAISFVAEGGTYKVFLNGATPPSVRDLPTGSELTLTDIYWGKRPSLKPRNGRLPAPAATLPYSGSRLPANVLSWRLNLR